MTGMSQCRDIVLPGRLIKLTRGPRTFVQEHIVSGRPVTPPNFMEYAERLQGRRAAPVAISGSEHLWRHQRRRAAALSDSNSAARLLLQQELRKPLAPLSGSDGAKWPHLATTTAPSCPKSGSKHLQRHLTAPTARGRAAPHIDLWSIPEDNYWTEREEYEI